jgi:hypothetical protein
MAIAAKVANGRSSTATEMVWRQIAPLGSCGEAGLPKNPKVKRADVDAEGLA